MTLHVYTASLKRAGIYDEPDLLDITRGTGGPRGSPFAPTWKILRPALAKNRQGGAVAEEGWRWYSPRFLAEMRVSHGGLPVDRYGEHERLAVENGVAPCPEAWANLLAMERVVIACHCRGRARCHRGLLAAILVRLGAADLGELPPPPRRQLGLPIG